MPTKKKLTVKESDTLIALLAQRFKAHPSRHPDADWETIVRQLTPEKLWSLQQMEQSGGEPDLVALDPDKRTLCFADCAPESPKGRRSLCYDKPAQEARKENKPIGSALEMAAEMGVTILNEQQYRCLQAYGSFDLKTSSWILTPESIRALDGALFCDRRYNHVFTYHNGAGSYYAARGFRAMLPL